VRAAKSSANLDRILGTAALLPGNAAFSVAGKASDTLGKRLADLTSRKSLTSFRPTRFQVTVAAALVLVVALAGLAVLILNSPIAGVHARLDVPNADHVRVQQPVTIRFDQAVDLSRTRVTLDPIAGFEVTKKSDRLTLTPIGAWATDKRYTVLLTDVPNTQHSITLSGWHAVFTTQPRVGIAGVLVDGKPAADPTQTLMRLNSKLAIAFTTAMKTSTVTINVNGQPLPPAQVRWASDNQPAPPAVPPPTIRISAAGCVTSLCVIKRLSCGYTSPRLPHLLKLPSIHSREALTLHACTQCHPRFQPCPDKLSHVTRHVCSVRP